MSAGGNESRGPRWVKGFDIETPYETADQKKKWHQFLGKLDPQAACRLCGVDHFPHWLASAPNWRYLIEYLTRTSPADMPVREALVQAIKRRRPDPKSEESGWWKAIEHLIPELETFAYLYAHGLIRPQSRNLMEDYAPFGRDRGRPIVMPPGAMEKVA